MRKSAQTVIRPDAYYTIAAANGRVLEVADFNTENGASVRLWSYVRCIRKLVEQQTT